MVGFVDMVMGAWPHCLCCCGKPAACFGVPNFVCETSRQAVLTPLSGYEISLKNLKEVVVSLADGPSGHVDFGRFRLLPQRRELRADGVAIALGGRAFDVLLILTEARGALVTKDEILSRVWPDTVVEENNLVVQISTLRKALGADRDFIRTVSGRGYRFVAEIRTSAAASDAETRVDRAAGAEAAQSTPSSNLPAAVSSLIGRETEPEEVSDLPAGVIDITDVSSSLRRRSRPLVWRFFASGLARLLVASFSWILYSRNQASPKICSIAVLPLENLSGDPLQDYFADGMTDELITALAQISALRVISRTSVMTYKRVRKLLPEIARELKVETVVEGTVLRFGDRVRITAQLIEVPVERHIWAQSFEGDLRDTLALQSSVARTIAEQIGAAVNQQEQAALQNVKPVNPVAYEAYLKGRYFLNKRTGDGLKKAIEYFSHAIETAPTYAAAYAALADAYALSGDWKYGVVSPREAFKEAEAAATKALALDESLGEAHASLAFVLDLYAWNWASSEIEYKRAIELNPGYPTAHQWYSWHLMMMGRNREDIRELRKAESLDPLSLIISADIADAFCVSHLYDEAVEQSKKALEMDPNFAVGHYELGQALVQKHMHDEAIVEFQRAIELSGHSGAFDSNLGYAYAVSGRKEEAIKIVNDLEAGHDQNPSADADIAFIYVGLGDQDQAMISLNKAYEARFKASILLRPAFDPLRSDARFQDLLRRIGLPQAARDQLH
jgi:TolB-like protein/DNA-binding winged helix-turn-helix (wHTH) protein/Tfp pilus assembly protein PilF